MAQVPSTVSGRIWTARRRFWGNFIPMIVWFPMVTIGVLRAAAKGDPLGEPLMWIAGGTVLAWFLTNWFGLFQNRAMRRELERHLHTSPEAMTEFVGFASPSYGSFTDSHEDVGFLQFLPDRVKFTSETRSIQVFRVEFQSVHFRANVHSLVGLGRWIAIEGTSDGQRIRLMIEPRRFQTMFANFRYSGKLKRKLTDWWKAK